MTSINTTASGQFRIGDITVNRLGYGAMNIAFIPWFPLAAGALPFTDPWE